LSPPLFFLVILPDNFSYFVLMQADHVFDEDAGFYKAIKTLLRQSKRPIVLLASRVFSLFYLFFLRFVISFFCCCCD